ncbi:MAG: TolC family protein [Planctomycetota bacterium]
MRHDDFTSADQDPARRGGAPRPTTWVARSAGSRGRRTAALCGAGLALLFGFGLGCQTWVHQTDREVAAAIESRQRAALSESTPVTVGDDDAWGRAPRTAYATSPHATSLAVPPGFNGAPAAVTSAPATPSTSGPASMPSSAPTTQPTTALAATQPATAPARSFRLTDALRYAQQHRREFRAAQEDLYLAALALTLERHLWTPIFSSQFRTVYGNYGEAQDFDQAMRFVADLGVAQRLPLGGQVTAQAIGTLIRDVKKTITAQEQGQVKLGLTVPLLRGAGHVARETRIQLERELTYAVRAYERFRRQQLVTVAQGYFDLLLAKQNLFNAERSFATFVDDYERAKALEQTGQRSSLDTLRAEQAMLSAENDVEDTRESFRAQADNFKLLIGMPVDQPLTRDELEDIEQIERQIAAGTHPLLARPPASDNEQHAVEVALDRRLDLLTAADRVDDARRGVAISRNALLPDLNWTSSLSVDTDPNHYNAGAFEFERAKWLSEMVLSLPVERTAERNALRRALIDVRQAERNQRDLSDRIRAEVRRAVNRIRLADRSVEIQQRNVFVAERRQEYAKYRFEEVGDISNRDKVEAETELLNARNRLNAAKTARWTALLQFRLATETLYVEEGGPADSVAAAPNKP